MRLRWLQLHGLATLALAQPLLDQLGRNPTFFVAHRTGRLTIVAFGLVVFLVPGLLAVGFTWLADRAGHGAAVFHGLVALLTAALFLPPLSRIFDQVGARSVPVAAVVGGVTALAVWRIAGLGRFLAYLGLGSALVLLMFLGTSASAELIWSGEADAIGSGGNNTPVVLVVLDEFALGSILKADLDIDPAKAPNLAAFARESTWYRNTVANWGFTNRAIPSVLTGQLATDVDIPVSSAHPQNLFSLTAPSHALRATEPITGLCPPQLCEDTTPGDDASLIDDARILFLHTLLPNDWADEWLPPITDRWAGFGQQQLARPDVTAEDLVSFPEAATDRPADIARFADELPDSAESTLSFLHSLLPHGPFEYTADGHRYDGFFLRGLDSGSLEWEDGDPELLAEHKRRYLNQVTFVDTLVGDLLATLREKPWYDDALVVLTSDHGVSFEVGGSRRYPLENSLSDVAFVPLFMKYPGQTDGGPTDSPAQTIDILPTIADVLDIELRDPVDGQSLLATGERSDRRVIDYSGDDLEADLDLAASVDHFLAAVGEGVSPAAVVGPEATRPLVGRRLDQLPIGNPAPFGGEIVNQDEFGDVVLGPYLPLRVRVRTDQDVTATLAIALDGVVVTGGLLDQGRADVLLPTTAVHAGLNDLQLFTYDGAELAPIDMQASPPWAEGDATAAIVTGTAVELSGQVWRGDDPALVGFARLHPERGVVGWVANSESGALADHVVLVDADGAVLAVDGERTRRVDVVRSTGDQRLWFSGFAIDIPEGAAADDLRVIALFADETRLVMSVTPP